VRIRCWRARFGLLVRLGFIGLSSWLVWIVDSGWYWKDWISRGNERVSLNESKFLLSVPQGRRANMDLLAWGEDTLCSSWLGGIGRVEI